MRVPETMFDTETGEGNQNDWIVLLTLACIRLNCIPVVYLAIDMLPVNILCHALLEMMQTQG